MTDAKRVIAKVYQPRMLAIVIVAIPVVASVVLIQHFIDKWVIFPVFDHYRLSRLIRAMILVPSAAAGWYLVWIASFSRLKEKYSHSHHVPRWLIRIAFVEAKSGEQQTN